MEECMAWRREETHPDSQDGGDGDSLVLGKRPHFLEELTLNPGTHLLCIESCLMNK